MIRPGQLDRRLELRRPSRVRNENTGAYELKHAHVATVWARRVPRGAAERLVGAELVGEDTVVYSIRYRADVSPSWTVKEYGDTYRVTGVNDGPGRRAETLMVCVREVPRRGDD